MADASGHTALVKVRYDQLQPGMIVREITELAFSFATLDADTVSFLKANFRGARAVLVGDAGHVTVPIAELKEFDQLVAIADIPSDLRISKVVPGLADSLHKRGFHEFKVTLPPGAKAPVDSPAPVAPAIIVGSSEARSAFEEKVIQVKTFLETVNPAKEARDAASNVIEDMMDRGRAGVYSSKGVERAIAEITEQNLGPAMQAIAGIKNSDQTYAHCVDMSIIMQGCYSDILERQGKRIDEAANRLIMVSGFMHDIGKSRLPKDIIDSTQEFGPDSKERILLRNHTTYGAEILQTMGMQKSAIDMARYHHVKRDTTHAYSYPDVPYEAVPPMVRFASIVDVYQALIGKRSYKRNWVPGKAIEYIFKRKDSEFDARMVDLFVDTMGRYPVVSLVRLNTGDLAFVLMIAPREHPHRPVVTIVENAKGERVTHHEIIDLMVEKDIVVQEIVDHYDHYKTSEEEAFKIFQSIEIG